MSAYLIAIALPVFGHALLVSVSAFLKKTSQLFDYGEIAIDIERLRAKNENLENIRLRQLIQTYVDSENTILFEAVLRNQIVMIPILRFTAVAPMLLYFLYFTLLWARETGIDMSSWDSNLIGQICVAGAILFQISYIVLKISSGVVDHLQMLHSSYNNKSAFAIVTDWTSLGR